MQHPWMRRGWPLPAAGVTLICLGGLMGCGGGSGTSTSVTGSVVTPAAPNSYSSSGAFNNGTAYSFNYTQDLSSSSNDSTNLPVEGSDAPHVPHSGNTIKLQGMMTAFGNTFPISGYQDSSGNQYLTGTLTTAGGAGFNLDFTIENIQGATTVTATGTNMAGTQQVNLTSMTQTASKY